MPNRYLARRFACALWLGFALAGPAAASALCDNAQWSLEAGTVLQDDSRWKEFDPRGQVLVSESGSLDGSVMSFALGCTDWFAAVQLQALSGQRGYLGQTSLGAPLATHSSIQQQASTWLAGWALPQGWWLNARLSQQTLDRTIASSGNIAGYPEFYERTIPALGVQWDTAGSLGTFSVFGWVSVEGTQRMRLQLPGKDPATLQLGAVHQSVMGLRWRYPLARGMYLAAELQSVSTSSERSQDVVIYSSGVPVGGAYQPPIETQEVPLSLAIGYTF